MISSRKISFFSPAIQALLFLLIGAVSFGVIIPKSQKYSSSTSKIGSIGPVFQNSEIVGSRLRLARLLIKTYYFFLPFSPVSPGYKIFITSYFRIDSFYIMGILRILSSRVYSRIEFKEGRERLNLLKNALVADGYGYLPLIPTIYFSKFRTFGLTAGQDMVIVNEIGTRIARRKKMPRFIDRSGIRYGRLIAIKVDSKNKKNEWTWFCHCDCGEHTIVPGSALTNGNTKSCGCLGYNAGGMSGSPLYNRWMLMLDKCRNPKTYKYPRFGGRGIKVCDRWEKSFRNFHADMGDPPEGTQLTRKDTNKNFTPENCIWATPQEAHNMNPNARLFMITYNGRTLNASQWAKEMNVSPQLITSRIKRGWSPEKALTAPAQKRKLKRQPE